jgi:hypothetical protein
LRFAIAAQSARLLDVSSDEKLELLRRFAPTLHFDALERWRPDLVDRYLERSTVLDAKNRTLPGTPPAEPAMHGDGDEIKAKLNPLRNDSDLDTQRRSTEMLSVYGPDQDLTGAGIAYGRVVPTAGEGLFLQYWLFYPDNPCVLPPGRHDGDWELVQVKVQRAEDGYEATQVTLAEHGKAVTRGVEPGKAGRGPDVFVAVDSHACYFDAGAHPALLSDVCDPAGAPGASPSVTPLPIAPDKRTWVHWSGRWGLDRGGGTRLALSLHLKRTTWPLTLLNKAGESPPSPAHQGTSWRFPKAFALKGTQRKWTTVALQRLAHFIGHLTWPKQAPHVAVRPAAGEQGATARTYAIEVGTAGRFLRRVSFVSVAFWEERPDGSRRALAMHSVRAGHAQTVEIPLEGSLEWRAAAYNRLRQRGEPIGASAQ